MISKHILMLGLSLLAAAGVSLDAVSHPLPANITVDPVHRPIAAIKSTLLSPRKSLYAPVPASAATSPVPPSVLPTVSLPPTAPSPKNHIPHPEYTYTALPFSMNSGQVSAASTAPWQLATIHNPASSSSPGALIAVIDTGFALSHTSLASRWWTNSAEMGPTTKEGPAPNCTSRGLILDKSCNNLDNDGDGYASDWRGYDFAGNDNDPQAGTTAPAGSAIGHGTFVAGLIAAAPTASYAGVDQSARIMPLQALDDNGSGNTSTVYDAIIYAVDHGAQIINLSLGASFEDYYLHEGITYASSKGVTVVAAAGNDGCECMLYPANYPEVVAVGATTMSDTVASFSSYGTNLDLVAPGQDLCSTSWTSSNQTSYYQCGGAGTSFAAPIVSGAIARLVEAGANPKLLDQFASLTSDKVSGMNGSWRTPQYGAGRLNVSTSLSAASSSQMVPTAEAIYRNDCSGINACSVQLTNAAGQSVQLSSKQPTGQAAAVYWQVPTSSGTPTLWRETNINSNSIGYFSSDF